MEIEDNRKHPVHPIFNNLSPGEVFVGLEGYPPLTPAIKTDENSYVYLDNGSLCGLTATEQFRRVRKINARVVLENS